MTVDKKQNGQELEVSIEGRLDTLTAPELESSLQGSLDGVTTLTMNLSGLDYISSAGLRVVLATHKKMTAQDGNMVVTNANEIVSEVFDATGFSDIIDIQ